MTMTFGSKDTQPQQRPKIPSEVKRQVRQRCGFGCVICGEPLYEYEHMLEWAKVKRHVAEEITLLCRFHHGQKTNGLLPKEDVEKANNNPYNLQTGVSKSLLLNYKSTKDFIFQIGDSKVVYTELPENGALSPILLDDTEIIGLEIENGILLLKIILFNEENDVVFQIYKNELIYNPNQWDIEWQGNKLTIRKEKGKIILQIKFFPPNHIHIVRAEFLLNGIELHAKKDYLAVLNNNIFIKDYSVESRDPYAFSFGSLYSYKSPVLHFPHIRRIDINRKNALSYIKSCLKGEPKTVGDNESCTYLEGVHIGKKFQEKEEKPVHVRELQRKLNKMGFYEGEIDGIVGETTRKALKRFMKEGQQ